MKIVPSLLIIDDNPFDVEIAQRILERSGRFERVYAASDGKEALDLFHDYNTSRAKYPDHFPPLLILLDINMPVMDGFGFLEEYARLEHPEDMKPAVVVMLTSSSYGPDLDRALAHDAVEDYIVKPITPSQAIALADRFGHEP